MRVGPLTFEEQEELCYLLDFISFTPAQRAYANSIVEEWEGSLLSFVTHVQLSLQAGQSIVDQKEVKE